MDRLSKLPEDVLDKILCFLPQKKAVRTCLLSRSWRYRGSTRSRFELSAVDDFFYDNEKFISVLDNSSRWYRDQNLCVKQLTLKMYPNSKAKYDLNSIVKKPEFIEEFCLEGCKLTNSTHHFLFKSLRKLSLHGVGIADRSSTLEMLLSSSCCPLIQNLKLNGMDFGISAKLNISLPTLEAICIINVKNWYFHDRHDFHRLKKLNIQHTQLHADSFAFFASNYMPCLEKFYLFSCDGFQEFRLSNPSIKFIYIFVASKELIKANIDAPNLTYFKLGLSFCSRIPSISFAPTSSEWKSNIDLSFVILRRDRALKCQRNTELMELLKALRQSQITLRLIYHCLNYIEDPAYNDDFNKPPIVVEHFHLWGLNSYSTVQAIFNSWFRAFRPRYLYTAYNCNQSTILFDFMWKVLVHDTESSWNQDLVEVSVETSYGHPKEWHPFHGNSISESGLANNQTVRLRIQWRE